MTQKIRNDLEGVVYVDGRPLKAGDEVPEGAEVGDHVLEGKQPPPEEPAQAEKPTAEKSSRGSDK